VEAQIVTAENEPGMTGSAAMEVLAQTSSPVQVGEIEVDDAGAVRPRVSGEPVSFSFTYHGINFSATLPMEDGAHLLLTATLGVIPFSMENAFGRKAARSIISRAKLSNGKLTVDAQSRVHLEMRGQPEKPRTPVNVLASVASLLMEAKPYLDLLEVSLARGKRRSKRRLT
jgi:hypothetical protein